MKFELPTLPFAYDALAPMISAETLEFHHNRHHLTYVENVNRLIPGTPFSESTLVEIIDRADGAIFNNASQAWNHELYWNSLCPSGSKETLSERFLNQVKADFGSMDLLKRSLRDCALSTFGSGWAWLVKTQSGRLRVLSTSNAETPLRARMTPLLVCDVWEHAYYIDYRNERAKYLDSFLYLMNMTYANHRFDSQEVSGLIRSSVSLLPEQGVGRKQRLVRVHG
jgi:Fe-Mn family superoxide dismutase